MTKDAGQSDPYSLGPGRMGTAEIVFFVLAGVAPMAVVVALLPLSIALGNGAGVPATYLIAGLVLTLFAIGYVQMSRRITNVGAFYTYAHVGLGRHAAGAAAYVALLAYNAATVGIFGGLAYFAQVAGGEELRIDAGWQWWALLAFVLVAGLAYFKITLSAIVLGVALTVEVLLLLVFDVAVLADQGFHGFSFDVFRSDVVFAGGGFGISIMLAFGSFVGFEATALYGEEARDPRRSVPRATYIAIGSITLFYLVTTWAAISAYGVDRVQPVAVSDPAGFMFAANDRYVGTFATDAMRILVVTSLFAAFLAFHCNTARYHYALARDGLLPRALSWTHPKYGSPVAASALQLGLVGGLAVAFGLAGQDPYLGMGASLYGLGVLALVLLQAIAAASIVGFFLRHRRHESVWAARVAPALGGLGLVVGLGFMIAHYATLTGGTLPGLDYLPWLLPIAAVVGAIAGGNLAGPVASTRH